jgi:hypothetical protein
MRKIPSDSEERRMRLLRVSIGRIETAIAAQQMEVQA